MERIPTETYFNVVDSRPLAPFVPAQTGHDVTLDGLDSSQYVHAVVEPHELNRYSCLRTPNLINRLDKLMPKRETNHFRQLSKRLLGKCFTLSPKWINPNRYRSLPPSHLSPPIAELCRLNKSIESEVQLPPLSVDLQQLFSEQEIARFQLKGSTAENWQRTLSGDIDLAVVCEVEEKRVRIDQLATVIKRCAIKVDPTLEQATAEWTAGDWIFRYSKDVVEGDGWVKIRILVSKDDDPVDLIFYDHFSAPFDEISGSTVVFVDTDKNRAIENRLIDGKTRDYLLANHLLWFHEEMEGGLSRISYRLRRQPHGSVAKQLLQPGIVGFLYERASPEERAAFLLRLLKGHIDCPEKSEETLLELVRELLQNLALAQAHLWYTDLFQFLESQMCINAEVKARLSKEGQSLLQEPMGKGLLSSENLYDAATGTVLARSFMQVLQRFCSVADDFERVLQEGNYLIVDRLNHLFPPISKSHLLEVWADAFTRKSPALQVLIEPVSRYYLEQVALPNDYRSLALQETVEYLSRDEIENRRLALELMGDSDPLSERYFAKISLLRSLSEKKRVGSEELERSIYANVFMLFKEVTQADRHALLSNEGIKADALQALLNLNHTAKRNLQIVQIALPWVSDINLPDISDSEVSQSLRELLLYLKLKTQVTTVDQYFGLSAKEGNSKEKQHGDEWYQEAVSVLTDLADIIEALPSDYINHYIEQQIESLSPKKDTRIWSNGDSPVWYSEKTGLYVGPIKKNRPNGKGVMLHKGGRLEIGEYRSGLLNDKSAKLFVSDGLRYFGAIEEGRFDGKGVAQSDWQHLPNSIRELVPVLIAHETRDDKADTSNIDSTADDSRSNLKALMMGNFSGAVGDDLDAIINASTESKITVIGFPSGENLTVHIHNGEPKRLEVGCYRLNQYPTNKKLQLTIPFQSDSQPPNMITGSQSHWQLCYDQAVLIDGMNQRRVSASYSPEQKALSILGKIVANNFQYEGEQVNGLMNGVGRYYARDGRFLSVVKSIYGRIKDRDIESVLGLISELKPTVIKELFPTSPFNIPDQDSEIAFSQVNRSGQKVYGVVKGGVGLGVIKSIANGVDQEGVGQDYVGEFWIETQYRYETQRRLYTEQFEHHRVEMESNDGTRYVVLPHGLGVFVPSHQVVVEESTDVEPTLPNEYRSILQDILGNREVAEKLRYQPDEVVQDFTFNTEEMLLHFRGQLVNAGPFVLSDNTLFGFNSCDDTSTSDEAGSSVGSVGSVVDELNDVGEADQKESDLYYFVTQYRGRKDIYYEGGAKFKMDGEDLSLCFDGEGVLYHSGSGSKGSFEKGRGKGAFHTIDRQGRHFGPGVDSGENSS